MFPKSFRFFCNFFFQHRQQRAKGYFLVILTPPNLLKDTIAHKKFIKLRKSYVRFVGLTIDIIFWVSRYDMLWFVQNKQYVFFSRVTNFHISKPKSCTYIIYIVSYIYSFLIVWYDFVLQERLRCSTCCCSIMENSFLS